MDVIKEYFERLGQREGAAKMQKDLIEGTILRAIPYDYLIPSTEVSRFHKEHRYKGYATIIDDRPVLYCSQHGGKFKPIPSELQFNPWYWNELGGAFTFSVIYQKQYIARIFVAKGDPVLETLENSDSFVFVLFEGKRISGCYEVVYQNDVARDIIQSLARDSLKSTPSLIECAELCFWRVLQASSFPAIYNRKDKLVKGWFCAYLNKLQSADEYYYKDARKLIAPYANDLKESASTAPQVLKQYLELLVETNINITSIFKYLDTLSDKAQWQFFYQYMCIYHTYQSTSGIKEFAEAAMSILIMYMYSATPTAAGTRIASINTDTGRLDYTVIDFDQIQGDALLEDYWNRIINHTSPILVLDFCRILKGDDIPDVPQETNDALSRVHIESTPTKLWQLAESMLSEAKSNKKWTIPWGATVQLNFGPYKFAQLYEMPTEIKILLRTSDWHYSLVTIPYKIEEEDHSILLDTDGNEDELKSAALFMLLSAVIRDFNVVEERQRVFKLERNFALGKKNINKEISIVYLPRVKYSYDYQLETLSSSLGFKERRAHFVSAHQRKSAHASDRQKILAEMYNFAIREGYTFVKPHERGHLKRETIYRCRSALQSLYVAEVYEGGDKIPDWFKFEKDVAKLMEKMGYTVDHVARNKNGDEGIDLFAYRQNCGQEENWVIQCKCYGKNKVGPAVIRELIGTLTLHKQKVNGMLVTTGDITEGAMQLAKDAGIETINGKRFLEMLNGSNAGSP